MFFMVQIYFMQVWYAESANHNQMVHDAQHSLHRDYMVQE